MNTIKNEKKKTKKNRNINKKETVNTKKNRESNEKLNNIIYFFKNLNKAKILKYLLILVIVAICFFVFMKFTLLITIDGSKYYSYLKHFRGEVSFGEWDTVRGFSFPLIIYLATLIFGDNVQGILICMFLFYIGLIYFAYKIIRLLINDNKLEKKQFTIWCIFASIFLFNPLIIGYGHTLLTEAVTPFFYMLLVYLCLKWNDLSFKENKKKYIIISFLMLLISIFVWFIKQPYAPTIWVSMFLISILSGIYNKNIRYFLEKFIVLIICVACTIFSISGWNAYLKMNGKDFSEERTNSSMLAHEMIGYTYHYNRVSKDKFCNKDYIKDSLIEKNDKKDIYDLIDSNEEWCDYIRIYNVTNIKGKLIDQEVIIQKNKSISFKESISFIFKSIIEHPILVLHSYYENYLAIINLENIQPGTYIATGKLEANVKRENSGIAYVVFHEGYRNAWWLWQDRSELTPELLELSTGLEKFEASTTTNSDLSAFMEILEDGSTLSFKLLLLISLPMFIYGFIMFMMHKKSISYLMITLLSGVSFIHVMLHVGIGAIIDRYCYPIYPLMLLCLVIMLMDKSEKIKKVGSCDAKEK